MGGGPAQVAHVYVVCKKYEGVFFAYLYEEFLGFFVEECAGGFPGLIITRHLGTMPLRWLAGLGSGKDRQCKVGSEVLGRGTQLGDC